MYKVKNLYSRQLPRDILLMIKNYLLYDFYVIHPTLKTLYQEEWFKYVLAEKLLSKETPLIHFITINDKSNKPINKKEPNIFEIEKILSIFK